MKILFAGFGGHFGPFRAVIIEPIQNKGIFKKNKKVQFDRLIFVRILNNLEQKLALIWLNFWLKNIWPLLLKNNFFWDFWNFWTKIFKSKSRWQRSLKMAISWFHVIFCTKNWLFNGQTQFCMTGMTLKKWKMIS